MKADVDHIVNGVPVLKIVDRLVSRGDCALVNWVEDGAVVGVSLGRELSVADIERTWCLMTVVVEATPDVVQKQWGCHASCDELKIFQSLRPPVQFAD